MNDNNDDDNCMVQVNKDNNVINRNIYYSGIEHMYKTGYRYNMNN